MPTYQFEAMDATGQEIRDVIEAANQEEAQATIRQMGYFVTKISVKKSRKGAADKKAAARKRARPSPWAASTRRRSPPSPASCPSSRTPACRSSAA